MPNRSSEKSTFEIVYIRHSLHALNLVPLSKLPRMNIIADHMVDKVINVHEKVKKKLETLLLKYKAEADKHRCFKYFVVEDQVMVHLCKDKFPIEEYNKLKKKKIGPFRILQKNR